MIHLKYPGRAAFWGGLGATLAILLLQMLSRQVDMPLLIAPFGASCVVLFLTPDSELARPRSLLGGYMIGTLVGLLALTLLPGAWWVAAPAVGLTVALMRLNQTVHPPAAAQPLVILLMKPGWSFLLMPTLPGVGLLLLTAWLFHHGAFRLTRAESVTAD